MNEYDIQVAGLNQITKSVIYSGGLLSVFIYLFIMAQPSLVYLLPLTKSCSVLFTSPYVLGSFPFA